MAPPVALMVTVADPTAAFAAAVSFSELAWLPLPGTLAGEKLAVTPAGRPVAENVTGEVNPPVPLTVTLTATLAPCVTLAADAPCVSVNPGGGVTVTTSMMVSRNRLCPTLYNNRPRDTPPTYFCLGKGEVLFK